MPREIATNCQSKGNIVLKTDLRRGFLATFIITALVVTPSLFAQDEAEEPKTPKKTEPKKVEVDPTAVKALTPAEKTAAELRKRLLKLDGELRSRLEDTVWNDLDLRAGDPGQAWLLREAKQVGTRVERAWYLNDDKGLPRVGSWQVKDGEILFTAMNGTVVGRGTFNDDEIVGKFIDATHHREFGTFRLREESKRNYRVLPMRDINPPRRRR